MVGENLFYLGSFWYSPGPDQRRDVRLTARSASGDGAENSTAAHAHFPIAPPAMIPIPKALVIAYAPPGGENAS